MPYFGKTKYAIVDDRGPVSKAVFHFTTHDLIAVALETQHGFVVLHDGTLYLAEGVISLARLVESLPEYLGFALDETTIIQAIVDFAGAHVVNDEEE